MAAVPNCAAGSQDVLYNPNAWSCAFTAADPVAPFPSADLMRCCSDKNLKIYKDCKQIQYCAAYPSDPSRSQVDVNEEWYNCLYENANLPTGITFCYPPATDPFSTECTSDGKGVPILPANITSHGCGVNPNRPNPNLKKCCGDAPIVTSDSCTRYCAYPGGLGDWRSCLIGDDLNFKPGGMSCRNANDPSHPIAQGPPSSTPKSSSQPSKSTASTSKCPPRMLRIQAGVALVLLGSSSLSMLWT